MYVCMYVWFSYVYMLEVANATIVIAIATIIFAIVTTFVDHMPSQFLLMPLQVF